MPPIDQSLTPLFNNIRFANNYTALYGVILYIINNNAVVVVAEYDDTLYNIKLYSTVIQPTKKIVGKVCRLYIILAEEPGEYWCISVLV